MNKKLYISIAIILIITGIGLTPEYIRKALIYQKAGIDDYSIFENRAIKTGEYQAWKISEDYNKFDILQENREKIEEFQTIAYLTIKDTSIIYEEYWDDYNEYSLTNSFSMAKSFISLMIGIAIDEGKIKNVNQKSLYCNLL